MISLYFGFIFERNLNNIVDVYIRCKKKKNIMNKEIGKFIL